MRDMKELTGVEWPLDKQTKEDLVSQRRKRREKLLRNKEHTRLYQETGLAYEVAEQLYKARKKAHLTTAFS